MATDYNLLGSTEVLEELQEGRTRELLMLLQDKPVPEVQDPLNLQGGLSDKYATDNNGDYILGTTEEDGSTAERPDDNDSFTKSTKTGLEINPNTNLIGVEATVSSNSSGATEAYLLDSSESIITQKSVGNLTSGSTVSFSENLSQGSTYYIVVDDGGNNYTDGQDTFLSFPYNSADVDITGAYSGSPTTDRGHYFVSVTARILTNVNSAFVTDQFSTPTTAPADFKQWNAIQARDVTTGGSTSADPVEFEILDSTDTALNSTRIPKARIADEPFTLRNRVYSESAGSDGQSDYQIAMTGDGGHFGIPVLTVVSVKKNGSVLDSANWSFDGDTTVTIDTSNVSIASGDTIEIKYDFDVFDSTLQPRAYLSRESTSETSPSISHFRYEYVI